MNMGISVPSQKASSWRLTLAPSALPPPPSGLPSIRWGGRAGCLRWRCNGLSVVPGADEGFHIDHRDNHWPPPPPPPPFHHPLLQLRPRRRRACLPSQAGHHGLVAGLGEFIVKLADGEKWRRCRDADHFVGVAANPALPVRRSDRRGQDYPRGTKGPGNLACRPGRRAGRDPVVDDDRDLARQRDPAAPGSMAAARAHNAPPPPRWA